MRYHVRLSTPHRVRQVQAESEKEMAHGTDSPPVPPQGEPVTALLRSGGGGRRAAFDRLVPIVYDTLRRIAHRALLNERRGHTLGTTALVHEAYARLAGLRRIEWRDRSHFFGVAAGAMRRILIDHAVARRAQKRGGSANPVPLDGVALFTDDRLDDVLAVHHALERLEAVDAAAVRIVECRVFLGMTIEETAEALGVSAATVKRHWVAARAWLTRELLPEGR